MVPVGRVGQAKSSDIAREVPFPTGCHLPTISVHNVGSTARFVPPRNITAISGTLLSQCRSAVSFTRALAARFGSFSAGISKASGSRCLWLVAGIVVGASGSITASVMRHSRPVRPLAAWGETICGAPASVPWDDVATSARNVELVHSYNILRVGSLRPSELAGQTERLALAVFAR